jgi:hypothetical protein
VPFSRFLGSLNADVASRRPPELGFCLLSAGWCVFFFTLSSCKLATYVLPAMPFLALALGHFLAETRWARSLLPALGAGIMFSFLFVTHTVALPWYAAYRLPMGRHDEVASLCASPNAPVVCYPRDCNSVSFYLRRSDLRAYRSKEIEELRDLVRQRPRVVILCTHRHSLAALDELLPPEVAIAQAAHFGLADISGVPRPWMRQLRRVMGETALGLCDVAIVERLPPGQRRPERGRGKASFAHLEVGDDGSD